MKITTIFATLLKIALIGQFSYFGISKVIGTPEMVTTFTAFGFPGWFMIVTGLIELAAVVLLIISFFNRKAVYAGAFLLAGLTICAALCHAFLEGSMSNAIIPLVVFIQNGLMVWLHNRNTVKKPVVASA